MTDFFNRVRNVASGRPPSSSVEGDVRALEPQPPPLNFESSVSSAPKSPVPEPGKAAEQPDLLGITPAVRRLAELATHTTTKTPLCIGVLGPAGGGKSFALNRLLADIAAYAAAAARTSNSPFLAQTVIAHVDAAAPGEPATRIAAALFEALHRPGPDGCTYPALAAEASDAITDPVEAARIARERLADARRRLDSEREALQEMNGRRTRLAESVLYEASGSRIDAHARAHRTSIESRLRSFGFTSDDPVATYKDLVRDVAENGGVASRVRACLRALWGFIGQTKLLVLAILFFAAAWGIGEAQASRQTWLGWLNNYEALKPAVSWIGANFAWLATARQAAIWAGVLALAWNLARAARFILPIFRGVSMFKADVETRHRDLDTLITNQTRRVDDMTVEIEPLSKRTTEAERRAANVAGSPQPQAKSPFTTGAAHQAAGFIAALSAAAAGNAPDTPQRIVVALDNLDALSPDVAANFLAHAQELLARPAFVTILTVGEAGQAGSAGLSRFIDVPLRLAQDGQRLAGLVKAILGTGAPDTAPETPVNAANSMLGQPMRPGEGELLEALAPIAARSPRDVKRFVCAYQLARGGVEHFGALAIALAVQAGATPDERAALDYALDGAPEGQQVAVQGADRIDDALKAASTAQSASVTSTQMRDAQKIAAQWSF